MNAAEHVQENGISEQKEYFPTCRKEHGRIQIRRSDLIPRSKNAGYTKHFIAERREWVSSKTEAKLRHISEFSIDSEELKGHIENMIGAAQVPIGIGGPLLVNGEHARGRFYIPFATTEGTLVDTYQRGILAITMAGGATVRVLRETVSFSPIFVFRDLTAVPYFIRWIKEHFNDIKAVAETTTNHGKLIEIVPYPVGRRVILDFRYYTADAMGQNMASIATEHACSYIMEWTDAEKYHIESNLSSNKKASFFHFLTGYGKEVSVETCFPREIVLKYLGTTPEAVRDIWVISILGSQQAGMVGSNCHVANALTAVYMACGQDVAHVVNGSVGTTLCELTETGDLLVTLKLPNIVIGTVGGGSESGTGKECLEMLGCAGVDKSRKFAEIIGATALAGEISLMSAITSGNFVKAHKSRRHPTGAGGADCPAKAEELAAY